MFDHCETAQDAWTTFYMVACLCHPTQGGTNEDIGALCDMFRETLMRFGQEYPDDWKPVPNLFDVFCKATNTPNPFGSIESPEPAAEPASAVLPFTRSVEYQELSTVGRIVLARRAA